MVNGMCVVYTGSKQKWVPLEIETKSERAGRRRGGRPPRERGDRPDREGGAPPSTATRDSHPPRRERRGEKSAQLPQGDKPANGSAERPGVGKDVKASATDKSQGTSPPYL